MIDWNLTWQIVISCLVLLLIATQIVIVRKITKQNLFYLECRKRLNRLMYNQKEKVGRRLLCDSKDRGGAIADGREVVGGKVKKRMDISPREIAFIDDDDFLDDSRRFDKIVAGDEPF